jgi:hypothetical protein
MEEVQRTSKRQNMDKTKGSSTVWCIIDVHITGSPSKLTVIATITTYKH